MLLQLIIASMLACQLSQALDNGLALTPPMGWLSWERFRCNVDCKNYPDDCISERLYMKMADLMVSEGFKDVGYEYVNIDDCWPAKERDSEGRLVADPERFPSGIKALAQYVHSKGLKLGIYEDFGTKTCAGYPGSEFYMETDAKTFAEWNVDMLKFDGCNSDPKDMPYAYPIMERYLNMTGRPILFLCQWPGYIEAAGIKVDYAAVRKSCNQWRNYRDVQDSWEIVLDIVDHYGENKDNFTGAAGPGGWNDPDMPNYTAIRESCNQWRNYNDLQDSWESVLDIIDHYGEDKDNASHFAGPGGWNDPDESDYNLIAKSCNLWRNYEDVTDSWESVLSIIDKYGANVGNFSYVAKPGAWNDPDMLVVGDFGLSYYQQKAQFGMWALFASPLFMSVDLRKVDPMAKKLLQNKNIIAINQDPLGNQATRLYEVPGSISVWIKKLSKPGSVAIGLLNKDNQGTPVPFKTSFSDLGFTNKNGYNVREAFENKTMGSFKLTQQFTVNVEPTSIFIMVADPL